MITHTYFLDARTKAAMKHHTWDVLPFLNGRPGSKIIVNVGDNTRVDDEIASMLLHASEWHNVELWGTDPQAIDNWSRALHEPYFDGVLPPEVKRAQAVA